MSVGDNSGLGFTLYPAPEPAPGSGHFPIVRGAHLQGMQNSRSWAAVCWMLTLTGTVTAASGQDPDRTWKKVLDQHGIVVSTREQPGQELPSFRGEGNVEGSVLHVLAVVLDDTRSREWAKDADEAKILRTIDARTQVVYTRSHQTWPIRDRDLVMKRTVEVLEPGRAFRVSLACLPGEKPEIEAAIRIKDCDTVFVLRKVGVETTHVDYRVRADPGGSNPAWAVRWASKNIPLETLVALRKQIVRTKGQYGDVMQTWSEQT
jgi:hypothetical protein